MNKDKACVELDLHKVVNFVTLTEIQNLIDSKRFYLYTYALELISSNQLALST